MLIGLSDMKQNTFTVEQILSHIGDFGRFQKALDLLLFIMNIPIACQVFIAYFVTLTPSWKCRNSSDVCTFNYTLPGDDARRCDMSRHHDWYYTEPRAYSLVAQFELDCGKEWLLQVLSSVYFLGWGTGGIVLGWVSDRYGRKTVLFFSVITTLCAGFATSFIPNIYVIIVIRFFIGFCNPGSTLQAFILISEYVGPKRRPLAAMVVFLSLPVGYILTGITAYLTKNWKMLYIISTAPYIFVLAFFKFVPESVKWLSIQEKTDDIKTILDRIASFNRTELPVNLTIEPADELFVRNTTYLDLFRTHKLFIQTLIQCLIWVVTGIAYYGLSLAADDLGGSPYRDFIIVSVFELPALAVAIEFCTRFGRKPTTLIPLFIGGLSSCVIVVVPSVGKIKVLRVLFGIFGKFCLSMTFDSLYTWSVELFPTSVRSKGMGFLQATSHISSGAAPFIVKGLKPIAKWLPFVVMAIPAVIGACIGLMLSETKVRKCGTMVESKAAFDNHGVIKEIDDTIA